MKKFVFRYKRILEVRIDKENDVKNRLAKINQLIVDKEAELAVLYSQNSAFLLKVEESMISGILASDLQAISANKAYLSNKIKSIEHEIDLFKEERKLIQKELIEANKQRKVMEKLREKEIEQYKELEAQEESKIVDQIVTYQSTMTRGDENG